jgi:glycosyltransferase involved in cell wall biosynthesis
LASAGWAGSTSPVTAYSARVLSVAVDVRRMQDRPLYGVGRTLANTLPLVAAGVDLVLLGDARRPRPQLPGFDDATYVALAAPPGAPEVAWLQGSAAWWLRNRDCVFHGTFNAAPFWLSAPLVVTIHDLSFEHHAEDFSRAKRWVFRVQCRSAARRARRILTPTESVKRDVCATYGIDPERIVVSPWAVDPCFHPRDDGEIARLLARHGVDRPYVVALGGARRRGLPVAVGAWRASGAWDRGVGLVVVGAEPPRGGPGITWLGRLKDEEWATVLAGADAFCYPTRFEGFGMPALEAAATGTPVVCARLEVLEEVLGPTAEWCDAPTVPAISVGLARVLGDPDRAAELRAAGPVWAAGAATWDAAAAATLRCYREAG